MNISAVGPEPDHAPHHAPGGFSDRFALGFTKLLRICADTFFAKRYGHRAIVLETVAAVPGMVGAMMTHLTCLRLGDPEKRRQIEEGDSLGTGLKPALDQVSPCRVLARLKRFEAQKIPSP